MAVECLTHWATKASYTWSCHPCLLSWMTRKAWKKNFRKLDLCGRDRGSKSIFPKCGNRGGPGAAIHRMIYRRIEIRSIPTCYHGWAYMETRLFTTM
jgi:hypothetical protein